MLFSEGVGGDAGLLWRHTKEVLIILLSRSAGSEVGARGWPHGSPAHVWIFKCRMNGGGFWAKNSPSAWWAAGFYQHHTHHFFFSPWKPVCEEREGERKILVMGRCPGHPQCHWDGGRRGHRQSVKVNQWSRTAHKQREKSIRRLWAGTKPHPALDRWINSYLLPGGQIVMVMRSAWDYLSDLLSNWEANLSRTHPGHISPPKKTEIRISIKRKLSLFLRPCFFALSHDQIPLNSQYIKKNN